jgi:Tfp pilus assembly protein PilN
MIKVNLLEGAADTRAQQRATKAAAKTTQQLIMVAGAFVLLLVSLASDYLYSSNRLDDANRQLDEQQRIATELKANREKKELLERQIKGLKDRIKIIDDLSKTQKGPSAMLTLINERLPANTVILERIGQTGDSISIVGTAKGADVVSEFARALELNSNGLFQNMTLSTNRREVEVPNDTSDPSAGAHTEVVFDFSISGNYRPTEVGKTAAGPPAPGAPPAATPPAPAK